MTKTRGAIMRDVIMLNGCLVCDSQSSAERAPHVSPIRPPWSTCSYPGTKLIIKPPAPTKLSASTIALKERLNSVRFT